MVRPDGLIMTGADGLIMTGADGVAMTNVVGLVAPGTDGLIMTGADMGSGLLGLQSFDPELATALDGATDDSNVNAAVVYHRPVTDADLAELRQLGVTGGTRFRALPAVIITARPDQIAQISRLPSVRSIYGNRTLQWSADTSRQETGLTRLRADADIVKTRGTLDGSGVTVAVLDTGIDAGHPDLAGRVVRNVKLADLQGVPAADFTYPQNAEGLRNTDLVYGHGTFVSGVVAGSGARSSGRYSGYAPGAGLVGLSAGDANLFFVLAGFDYLLANRAALNVRVVNCSFSANALFDLNDPVNIATKMLNDAGVNVVFSAGNTGPGPGTLNPYAVAPWVISVGATDQQGGLARFSSRGDFGSSIFRPTLVAPGVNVVGARASGTNVTGLSGFTGADTSLSLSEVSYYTTASGTSFSAPQVAGTVALMLQANPGLTPAEVRSILRRTATPLAAYLNHEVGAGLLNAHAAGLEAAFPARRLSEFRSTLDRGLVRFVKDAPVEFAGRVQPGQTGEATLQIPDGVLQASVQVAWGPVTTLNDLGLSLNDPAGARRAESNLVNLPGVTGRRERVVVSRPEPGAWHARVAHSMGQLGTAQEYSGVLEFCRVEYPALEDVGGYAGTASLDEIRLALRTYAMLPVVSGFFRPEAPVKRADLALALVQGARVPLYVAARPLFSDVTDAWMRGYVESVQTAPAGPIFPDAPAGGTFSPQKSLDRLTAAVALVRAAGLESEAQAASAQTLAYADAAEIPAQWRGHVHVAVRRGLVSSDASNFNPQQPLTRAQLAHALSIIIAGQIPPASGSLL
jgi:serine protease AprX